MILLVDGVLIQENHPNSAAGKFVIMNMHTEISLRPHPWQVTFGSLFYFGHLQD